MPTSTSSTQKPYRPQWALVTGSSQGLGKALAEELARRGISLILTSRRKDVLDKIAESLQSQYHVTVHTIAADLSSGEGLDVLWQWCKKQNLWPDMLINNAGQGLFGLFEKQKEVDIHRLLYLNMESLSFLCHRFGTKMMEKGGLILNVSSLVAFMPTPYFSVYSATKSYTLHFSRALHGEWKHKGVAVSCLLPGYMRTGFDRNANAANDSYLRLSHAIGDEPEKIAAYVVPRLLRRKPIIYANTKTMWLAKILVCFPMSLKTFVAKIFLKRFADTAP